MRLTRVPKVKEMEEEGRRIAERFHMDGVIIVFPTPLGFRTACSVNHSPLRGRRPLYIDVESVREAAERVDVVVSATNRRLEMRRIRLELLGPRVQ